MQYQTKKDYAYEQIKNDILKGKLKLGSKLVISDLARKYHMSHIPVREALSVLYREGLIENVPFVGARVVKQDLEKSIELNILRTELECVALRVALPFATDADVAASAKLLEKLRALHEAGNLREYLVVNRSFYVSLFSYGPFSHLLLSVKEFIQHGRISSSLIAPEHITESLKGHRELLQAVEARDVEESVRIYRREKNRSLNAILDVMKDTLLNPKKVRNGRASAFYTEESVRENRNSLLAQIDWLRKLIQTSEPRREAH